MALYYVDVVTIAAKNSPQAVVKAIDPSDLSKDIELHFKMSEDYSSTRRKIRSALVMVTYHGVNRLVLCPVGCGVFKNPAAGVAKAMHDELVKDPFVEWGRLGM